MEPLLFERRKTCYPLIFSIIIKSIKLLYEYKYVRCLHTIHTYYYYFAMEFENFLIRYACIHHLNHFESEGRFMSAFIKCHTKCLTNMKFHLLVNWFLVIWNISTKWIIVICIFCMSFIVSHGNHMHKYVWN